MAQRRLRGRRDRDGAAAGEGGTHERQARAASVPRGRNHRADLLPLKKVNGFQRLLVKSRFCLRCDFQQGQPQPAKQATK